MFTNLVAQLKEANVLHWLIYDELRYPPLVTSQIIGTQAV
ncbi:hypothetical protein M1N59_01935 [Dehalococcoidales bacterium]|nr:hypothetical protein [Dehalococcoidales bacterium]